MVRFIINFSGSLRGKTRSFRRDADGAMIILGLMFFLLMGGVAIDLMRYEITRTMLQNTLDRHTLAAASPGQKLSPEAVVADCRRKAGLADQLQSAQVIAGLNERIVHMTGVVPVNGQINLGPKRAAKYNVTALNSDTNQNCVDLPPPICTNA